MTPDAWTSVAVVCVVFGVLAFTRIAPYLVLIAGMVTLLAFGILEPASAFAGFSNPGMITVGGLFVVAGGLHQTGVLAHLVYRFLGHPKSMVGAQARLILPVIAGSTVLNNTPLVAMLIPAVKDWSRATGFASSKLLIPLSFAAILGGMCTLIGTSTNLVVSGLLVDAGRAPLSFLDPAWVGVPCALVGAAFLLAFGRRLLPDRSTRSISHGDPREYTVEMLVVPGGPLVGASLEAAGLRSLPGLYVAEIHRGEHILPVVDPSERLMGGDQLVLVGLADSVVDLLKVPGLGPATREVFKLDGERASRCFAEAVISRSSPLVGQTVRDAAFRSTYNAVVLAIARNGERIASKIGDVKLQPGDALLVEALPSFVDRYRNSSDYYLVSRFDGVAPPLFHKAPLALAILVLMVVAAATGLLSMIEAAFLAAGAMLLTRCCSEETALRSIDWQLLLAIAASLALGRGLQETGAAQALADLLLAQAGTNPWLALALLYGVATGLSELVTNNAAAVIVFPIALAVSDTLHVSHMPFVIAVMIAASASFATPLGYQTNLMVYGAGGYRFGDFLRIGLPMNALLWVTTTLLAPIFWPF